MNAFNKRSSRTALWALAALLVRAPVRAASSDTVLAAGSPPSAAAAAAVDSASRTMLLMTPAPILGAVFAAAAVPDEQAKAPQRFLSPGLADGVNDDAVFGPGAAEVGIYDRRGRRVFHGVRKGGAPIVWNGKDSLGRVVETGVYVAMIRKTDSGVCYQSFVLVR